MITNCKRCDLWKDRKQVVIGRGPKHKYPYKSDILFIGEAPGESENALGKPFVGRSGELLDYVFDEVAYRFPEFESMSYYITNCILCRPLNKNPKIKGTNRKPYNTEIEACRENILLFFKIIKPQKIVLIGKVAEEAYKKWFKGIRPVCCILHPAFHLRKGGKKSPKLLTDIRKLVDFLKKE